MCRNKEKRKVENKIIEREKKGKEICGGYLYVFFMEFKRATIKGNFIAFYLVFCRTRHYYFTNSVFCYLKVLQRYAL